MSCKFNSGSCRFVLSYMHSVVTWILPIAIFFPIMMAHSAVRTVPYNLNQQIHLLAIRLASIHFASMHRYCARLLALPMPNSQEAKYNFHHQPAFNSGASCNSDRLVNHWT